DIATAYPSRWAPRGDGEESLEIAKFTGTAPFIPWFLELSRKTFSIFSFFSHLGIPSVGSSPENGIRPFVFLPPERHSMPKRRRPSFRGWPRAAQPSA